MPYDAMPTVADVQQVWLATGLFPDPTQIIATNTVGSTGQVPVNWESRLRTAIQRIARDTGRQFTPQVQTRKYNPPYGPNATLGLKADLLRLTSAVLTDPSGAGGMSLVQNNDFYLGPQNADQDGQPWQWLKFINYFPSPLAVYQLQSLALTGVWGYVDDGNGNPAIPDDVWDAVAQLAASLVFPEMLLQFTSGIVSIDRVSYMAARGGSPLETAMAAWQATYAAAVIQHKRVTYF